MSTTPGNGDAKVTMTVKELVDLHGQRILAEVQSVSGDIKAVSQKVDSLTHRVGKLEQDVAAGTTRDMRDDWYREQGSNAQGQRRSLLVVGITTAIATTLSLANLITFLVVSHYG